MTDQEIEHRLQTLPPGWRRLRSRQVLTRTYRLQSLEAMLALIRRAVTKSEALNRPLRLTMHRQTIRVYLDPDRLTPEDFTLARVLDESRPARGRRRS